MNLCIDIGNTLVKVAVFEGDIVKEVFHYETFGEEVLESICTSYPAIRSGILSTVRDSDQNLELLLKERLEVFINLDFRTSIPVENLYQTRETLGKDRLAVIIGGNYLYPGTDLLVIDAGSAITFDFINFKGQYLGGNIAPGLSMRFRSLHEFTSRLPLLQPDEMVPFLGRNTKEAIVAGVQNSLIFETEAYIEIMMGLYPGLKVLMTGGDAKFFENKLKNSIFVLPNLVLIGLNRILNFGRNQ